MLPTERRVAIDVGANEGLYSLRLSAMFEHVFSFEINAAIAADLVATQLANVTVVSNGLSRSMGRATLYVPVLPSGQRLHGWASLNVGNCPDAVDHDRHDVAIATLDSYGIDNASFLKIDVEGHEFQMLEGARATIERCKPRILIEIKSANLSRVRAYFAALGYREIDLRKLLRAPPTPENHLFFPGDGAR
jgi:FkbM family methyltransferase